MPTRPTDKAGTWYRDDKEGLIAEIENCLAASAVPAYPGLPVFRKLTALVVPHAGLAYSGAVAALAYGKACDCGADIDVFVLYGASHRLHLPRPAIWPTGSWETPLGDLAVDGEMAEAFIAGGAGTGNMQPHFGDNAIELQTPFIKYLFPRAKILPVAISATADAWRMGEIAAGIAAESGKRVLAIASTDLTHYGASFGIMPAGTGQSALEWARKNDQPFLDALTDMRLPDIVPIAKRDNSACGAGAAAAIAGWAKASGCERGVLLAYTNSHEVMPHGEAEHFVGYAALAYGEIVNTGLPPSLSVTPAAIQSTGKKRAVEPR